MTKMIVASVVFAAVAAAMTLFISMGPNPVGLRSIFSGAINPDVFADGIGVYVFNDKKYSMLIWKKRMLGPNGAPQEKDILEASQQPVLVKKDVRFFAYGVDFSKWPAVPPYVMAFCIARDPKTVDGIFPIRIKALDQNNMIYELLLPPVIDNLSSGTLNHLFWGINFQYSCNEGWVFKFQ